MRVAHVAPLYERVPPMLYGGTERIVSYLVEEQVRRGHEVTLFASGDSRTAAAKVAPVPRALRLDASHSDPLAPHVVELAQVFDQADDFDLIHSHLDYLAFPFSRLVATPTVHTLHGRLDLPHLPSVMSHFADVPLVSISNAQRRPLDHLELTWTATVYHGLPLEFYAPGRGDGRYLAFLGRISPEKGPALAIAAAKAAGMRLKIAAKVDPLDRAYFESEIEPLLADPLVAWPHDTAIAAAGLRRYGFTDAFLALATGLFDAARHCDGHRLPELFCGFPRSSGYGPTPYPTACSPQAWAAGVVSQLLGEMLGLSPEARENRLTFVRPVLPEWLPSIEVRGLQLGRSRLDVMVTGSRGGAVVEVLERQGDVEVVVRR